MGAKECCVSKRQDPSSSPQNSRESWRLEQMHTCDSSAPVTLILVNMHTYVPVLVNIHTRDTSISYAHL